MTAPARSSSVLGVPPATRRHDDQLGRYRDLDDVVDAGLAIADAVRDHDPTRVEAELLQLTWRAPGAAVQILMALAVLLPVETMSKAQLAAQITAVTHCRGPVGGAA